MIDETYGMIALTQAIELVRKERLHIHNEHPAAITILNLLKLNQRNVELITGINFSKILRRKNASIQAMQMFLVATGQEKMICRGTYCIGKGKKKVYCFAGVD